METMKKLHEAFLLLCGRVHQVHSALQNCKDDYLSYRRRFLGDPADIFAPKGSAAAKSSGQMASRGGIGPSPFGGTKNVGHCSAIIPWCIDFPMLGTSDPLSRTISHLTSGTQQGGDSGWAGGGHSYNSFSNRSGLIGASSVLGNVGAGFGTPSRATGTTNNSVPFTRVTVVT